MRCLLALCCIWLACSALAQPSHINLEMRAMTLHRALPTLSQSVGLELLDTPQTANDVLLVKARDVTADELLKKIALALNATWTKEGNSLRLVRTPPQRKAEEREDFRVDVAQIQRAINDTAGTQAKQAPWTKEAAEALASRMARLLKAFEPSSRSFQNQLRPIELLTPYGRLMGQVAASLDASELATIPFGIQVVYSTQPNLSQRKMSAKTAACLQQFARHLAMWQAAKEAKGVKPPLVDGVTYFFPGLNPEEKALTQAPAKALLLVSRWTPTASFGLELVLADARGDVLSRSSHILAPNYDSRPWQEEQRGVEKTIELTGDDLEFSKAWFSRPPSDAVSAELREKLVQPEIHEPISFVTSPSFFQMAEAKGVNLIAHLTDNEFATALTKTPQTGSKLLSRFVYSGLKVDQSEGWMVITPGRPLLGRQLGAKRNVLGAYLRRLGSAQKMSLEEVARFQANLPYAPLNMLPFLLTRFISDSEITGQPVDQTVLRFYGTLTPEQVNVAKDAGLPLSGLKPEQLAALRKVLYAPGAGLQLVDSARRDPVDFSETLGREITECFPNGLPPDAVLRITETGGNVVATLPRQRPDWTEPPRYMSAGELAMEVYMQANPEIFPWTGPEDQKLDLGLLQFGTRRKLAFTFQLSKSLYMQRTLLHHDVGDEAKPIGALPEAFRAAFEKGLESQKKMHPAPRPGQGGVPAKRNIPPA
ncbi:MAG: hypothetical protein ACAH95_02795 [Fimbriimonas sp.]